MMKIRHLNKIVFIKSADIDYQEINLNGNVHFTGDQGVGKSTVLRAILFFYNARTNKLGINAGDENFLDFYFKYANSYIFYEINTEHNKFTIWLTKELNRQVYRIIDTEYDKELFFEKTENGYRPLKTEEIKQKLREKNISISRKISLFNEFRDILYGANKEPKFKPYSIMQSFAYQNVPNTITNIFLNAQLNSDKIKQTIILSLIGEELSETKQKFQIDLSTIRKDISDFEQDFNDISDFETTKIKAKKLISVADDFKKAQQERILTAKNLGESLIFFQNKLIETNKEFTKAKQNLDISNDKIIDIKEKHTNSEKLISDEITIIKSKISDAKKKEEYWQNVKADDELIGIENILITVANEKTQQNNKNAKTNELQTLKSKFESIEQKYKIRFTQIENDKNASINTLKNQYSNFKNEIIETKQKTNDYFLQKAENISDIFEKNTENLQKQKEFSQNKLSGLLRKRDRINTQEFYKDEIEKIKIKITEIENTEQKNISDTQIQKNNIENIRIQFQSEEELHKNKYETENSKLIAKLKDFENQIKDINLKLQSFENSFYKYLSDNYEGWEDNIAKVCDETVLFTNNLKPKLSEKNNSFYGIELDLTEVASKVKTISEYENDKEQLRNEVEQIKKELQRLNNKFEEEKTKFIKSRKQKINSIKKKIEKNDAENYQNQIIKSKSEIQQTELIEKAKNEKIRLLSEISPKITTTEKELLLVETKITEQKNIKKNQKDKISEDKKLKLENLEEKLNLKKQDLKIDLKTTETDYEKNYQTIKDEQINELSGKGADTDKIKIIEDNISKIERFLDKIKKLKKQFVNKYEVEKIEINKIQEYTETQNNKEPQLAELETENKKELFELNTENKKIKVYFNELDTQKDEIKTDIDEYDKFKTSEATKDLFKELEYFITKTEKTENHGKLSIIIDTQKNVEIKISKLGKFLKKQTAEFVSPFRKDNIFHFPKQFFDDTDCLSFVDDNLKEYIEEEKIEDVKQRIKKKHSALIEYIVGDINLLTSKRKKIDTTIAEINKDFKNSNFVSVIQEFKMDTKDTANKIVQVLLEIKKFHDENKYDFGEPNLFSGQKMEENNQKSIKLLTALLKNLKTNTQQTEINLEDIFELKFKVTQNNKDTGWKNKLSDVGSHGTDILLKAMIYIMLLNVFKEKAAKKSKFKDFRLHCIMDEIGRIHSKNIKSLIEFANRRDIWMIFGSPEENDALAYKYVYNFEKEGSITTATRLIYDKRN